MKVLGISGSIRVNPKRKEILLDCVNSAKDLADYKNKISALESVKGNFILSNSEIILGASLLGAKLSGAEIDYIPLMDIFKRFEKKVEDFDTESLKLEDDINYFDMLSTDEKKVSFLLSEIKAADGIILSTPTYFGDRSSVANKFLQLTSRGNLLRDKVFSLLSVGAKRNGGQETTNIFALFEALSQGAYVVGNGPKTSQYGGTTVGGDKKAVLADDWGLETCFATGKRNTFASQVIQKGLDNPYDDSKKLEIKVLMTMDMPDHKYINVLNDHLKNWISDDLREKVNFEVINLTSKEIYRCLGCNICPIPDKLEEIDETKDSYACIIGNKKDSVEEIRDRLLFADGIIFAGVNTSYEELQKINYRYQAFMERTRFIRRNDFELTNIPATGLLISEVGATGNLIYNLKVMTSYMRHNTIIVPPINIYYHNEKCIIDGKEEFDQFIRSAETVKTGRKMTDPIVTQYIAGGDGGYEDTRLDHTKKARI